MVLALMVVLLLVLAVSGVGVVGGVVCVGVDGVVGGGIRRWCWR